MIGITTTIVTVIRTEVWFWAVARVCAIFEAFPELEISDFKELAD